MQLSLHKLRVFCAVIEHGGFSRAAKALHVSQPAVSKTVRELEELVELPLLERGTHRVLPTEAGHTLHQRARAMLELEHNAREELRAQSGLEHGSLRVGASTTIATYWLPPPLAAFTRAHPGLEIHVTSANTSEIARLLLDYAFDIALVEGPVEHPKVESRIWAQDELVLVVAPSHPWTQLKELSVETLPPLDLIMREEGSGMREVIEEALRRAKLPWRTVLDIGSTGALKQMVASGLGAAFVSRAAAQDQCALGRLQILPVRGLEIHRPLYELSMPERPASAAARGFREVPWERLGVES